MAEADHEFVKVKAIDILPNHYALWCSVGGDPFPNDIGERQWSDDGEFIYFILESLNTLRLRPDQEASLIKLNPSDEVKVREEGRQAAFVASRPKKVERCQTITSGAVCLPK